MCGQSDQKHAGQCPDPGVWETDRHHGPAGPDEAGGTSLSGVLSVQENAGHHSSADHQQGKVKVNIPTCVGTSSN